MSNSYKSSLALIKKADKMLRSLVKKLPVPIKAKIKQFYRLRERRAIAMGYYEKKLDEKN